MKPKSHAIRSYTIKEAEVCVRRHDSVASPLDRALFGLRQLQQQLEFNRKQTEYRVGVLCSRIRQRIESGVQGRLPHFASASTHVFAAVSQPISSPDTSSTLTPHQQEIRKRVSHIPVYLVAKKNGKLVYVKPGGTREKPVGMLFFAANSAKQLMAKVRQDVPEFGNDVEVISLDLGSLYEMFTTDNMHHIKNVMFRFVPEADQVHHAMRIMKENGRKANAFSGVPIFHVDGMVTGDDRLRPLFFDKNDLDQAIDRATSRKLEKDRMALRDEMEIQKGEAEEARLLAQRIGGSEAQKWMSLAAKAEAKSRKLGRQIKQLPDSLSSVVRVEVRSLEDVLSEMERDRSGLYGSNMLIPAGMPTDGVASAPFTTLKETKKIIAFEKNRA